MRRFILALDMGLGKTLIGCVFAKAFQQTFENLKIIIVCPVSLKKEWNRTAEEATGLQVDEDAESTNVTIHSWAKIPSEVPASISNYIVVLDEAHSMQSMTAQRTKTTLQLVQPDRCIGVLMLTGTPMKNGKPLNLFPLLRAARHPFGDNQKAFERHFCNGHDKSFGNRIVWDANGSSNLVQLRQHVASHLLYMTKEECLETLPPKTREFKQVPVSSRYQLQHDSALNELAKVYNTTGSFENSGDMVLTAVQRVRQIGSFAKIDATVAVAKLVLLEQPAVVIFTSFVTVAKNVHKQLAEAGWQGEILTGETPSNKRQQLVDNFQVSVMLIVSIASTSNFSRRLFFRYSYSAAFLCIGWSITCICTDVWCWRCRNHFDGGSYHYLTRPSLDTGRSTASRGSCPTNRSNQASNEYLDDSL